MPFASYAPYLKMVAETILTILVVGRLFSFLRRHQNAFLLAGLVAVTILLYEKSVLLKLPHVHSMAPYLFGILLGMMAGYPELSKIWSAWGREDSPVNDFLNNGPLDEVVRACHVLSQSRVGALLALQRSDSLDSYTHRSVVIDAKIRHELLLTIFTPPTYLHDGGVIVRGRRIISCSTIFPLSENPRIKKDLGTRHRAALGMSEVTDALCLIVSEETGLISIADGGSLFYGISPENLKESLKRLLHFKKIKHPNYLEPVDDTL